MINDDHTTRNTNHETRDTMTIVNALNTRLNKITSTLNDALSTLTLNDLDDAVNDMRAIEHALYRGQAMWGELEADVAGDLASFH